MIRRLRGSESGQSAVAILGTMGAVVVLLVAAFGVYRFVIRDDGGPPDVPIPPLHEFTELQRQRLHEIRDGTAKIREVPANATTHEGTLTRDEYRGWIGDTYGDLTPREERKLRAFNVAFRLLHMIGPDDDLLASEKQQESEDVIGFYHFEENELVLVGDGSDLTLSDDFTLSHEYVHSFQNEFAETPRMRSLAEEEEDGDPTEYATTVSCVREGDATLASALWARETIGEDWADKLDASSPDTDEPAPEADDVPPALERYFHFDYDQCVSFVSTIFRHGGWSEVNGLYAGPPVTTEQILHPKKYLDAERPTGMTPVDIRKRLGKGWSRELLGIFGEFDVYNYLLTALGDEQLAAQVAGGWGTGWVGVYANDAGDDSQDDDVVVHIALDWDTRRDAREFAAVYVGLIDKAAPGQGAGDTTRCWSLPGEFGYFNWDAKSRRTDIVISNNEGAVKAAAAQPLSLPARACAAWAAPGQQPAVVNSEPACELAKPGREIKLVAVGDVPEPLLERLRVSLRAEYGLPVGIAPAIEVGASAFDQDSRQLIAERAITAVNGQVARNPGDVVIAVTLDDLKVASSPGFVFSWGAPSLRVAILSTARVDPQDTVPAEDDELLFVRIEKMVATSIGVLYLEQPLTPDPRSLMYDSADTLKDIDAMGDDLCAT